MPSVVRAGEWAKARRMIVGAGAKLRTSVRRVLADEAERAREAIREGIERQAPGGAPIRPPAPGTLAARVLRRNTSTKALAESGELYSAITKLVRNEQAFVGVRRGARGRDGRPLAVIAQLHELGGTMRIRITPAMRRYLFALARASGNRPARTGGRRASGRSVVVVQVPARPFLRPSFEVATRGARDRVREQIARGLGWR